MRKTFSTTLLAGVSAFTLVSTVYAQEAAPTPSSDDSTVVVVTGSRVISSIAKSPTPITTVSNDALQTTQPGTIADGLNNLPVFSGSRNQYSNPGAGATGVQGGNGAANVLNLRNLGANRNLVLYDGHRIPPSLFNSAVDVDLIPQALIQNVDIVTGGVSAVYGSDAVSGVINFVANRRFNGVSAHTQYGISERGDNVTFNAGVAGGTDLFDGKGHISGSYEYRKNDGIPSRSTARDWLNLAATQGGGTAANPFFMAQNVRSSISSFGGLIRSGPLAGQDFAANGVLTPFDTGTPTGTANYQYGGAGTYANLPMAAALKSQQFYTRFDYDFSDNLHGYFVAAANIKTNTANGGYQGVNNVTLTNDNAFLPAIYAPTIGSSFKVSKSNLNLDESVSTADTRQYFFNTGLEGHAGDYRWQVNMTHGTAQLDTKNPTNANNTRLAAALDAVDDGSGHIVCKASQYSSAFSGCVPINLFGPTATTQAMLDYITGYSYMRSSTAMDDVDASISGSPFSTWAGPVKMALSAEWRNVSFKTQTNVQGTDLADCASLGYVSANCTTGVTQAYAASYANLAEVSQSVKEAAFEFDAPLLADVPLVQSLNLNGAIRYTSYSTSGEYTTWKVGVDWHVNDELRFRATDSQDIRAPTLYDLFQPVVTVPLNITDPNTGHPLTNVPSINQGNPDLTAEIGHTLTAGTVWRPQFLPGSTFTLDTYYMKVKNAITTVQGWNTGGTLCNQSGGTSIVCSLITRPGTTGDSTTVDATAFYAKAFNLASIETYGVDIEADYNTSLFGRGLSTRVMMNYQPHIYYYQFGGKTDQGGVAWGGNGLTAAPAFVLTAFVNYKLTNNLTVDILERYRNKIRQSAKQLNKVWDDPYVDAFATTNITLTYDFGKRTAVGKVSGFFTVENLFDQDPPLTGNTSVSTGGGSYGYSDNPVGRMFTVGIKIRN